MSTAVEITRLAELEDVIERGMQAFVGGPLHSRKPDEFYELVDALCPPASKLDMFAREARPGWQVWGAEASEIFPGNGADS